MPTNLKLSHMTARNLVHLLLFNLKRKEYDPWNYPKKIVGNV